MKPDIDYRLLPRFTDDAIEHDPLEIAFARKEAERQKAIADLEKGKTTDLADPADLRGIPVQAPGVGGTSPGTDPYWETQRRLDKRST